MTDGGDSNIAQSGDMPPVAQVAVQSSVPQPANQVQMQAAVPPVAPASDFVLLNDEPSVVGRDPLDFEDVAGDLADTILRSRVSSPLTLGIEGGWGSDKSTLARAVLEGDGWTMERRRRVVAPRSPPACSRPDLPEAMRVGFRVTRQ